MFKKRALCLCLMLAWVFLLHSTAALPSPRPQQEPSAVEPADLEAGVEAEDKDLQGASSFGYGYYSSPYIGSYYGGYYPYYSGGFGSYGHYGLGYPYYGGYYGLHHHHGHYGHYY